MKAELFDRVRFENAPCYICGYNGPGYFQPATHSCAKKYHKPTLTPLEIELGEALEKAVEYVREIERIPIYGPGTYVQSALAHYREARGEK